MTQKPVAYISGPMTGIPEFNYPAFFAAAEMLEDLGCLVLNPALNPYGLSDAAYMDIDLAMVRHSTLIVLLHGYDGSLGAAAEIALATRLGIDVVHIDECKKWIEARS